jgi:hypothetical protein
MSRDGSQMMIPPPMTMTIIHNLVVSIREVVVVGNDYG